MDKIVKEVRRFEAETADLEKLSWAKIISFFTSPYHLSYYYSFKKERRRTLKSFWRFSAALSDIKIAHNKQIISTKEWDDYLEQYIKGTFDSENEQSRLLIMSEVVSLI